MNYLNLLDRIASQSDASFAIVLMMGVCFVILAMGTVHEIFFRICLWADRRYQARMRNLPLPVVKTSIPSEDRKLRQAFTNDLYWHEGKCRG